MQKYLKPCFSIAVKSATPRKWELSSDQIQSLKTAADVLLAVVGVAGLVMVSVAAPNALKAFKILAKNGKRETFSTRQRKLVRSFYYLKDKGYIQLHNQGKDFHIDLTEKGRAKVDRLKLDLLKIKKPLIWDRKFWQVAADIPLEYRKGADALRKKLKQLGFYSLQRTLWFYPYDPRKEIKLLTETYKIDQFVTVMKIASLDLADQKSLYTYFKETKVVEF